jgi:hypothetical protein
MPYQTLDKDLQEKVQQAIAAGAPKAEALQRAEIIQNQRALAPVTQQPQQPGLIRTLLSPLERVARTVGAAGFEVANNSNQAFDDRKAAQDSLTQSLADLQAKIASAPDEESRKRYQNILDQVTQTKASLPEARKANPFMDEETLKKFSNPTSATLETGKTLAGLASYAIPFGKGAGIAKQAIIPGATSAGLFEAGLPGSDAQSIAQAGATGAITAPAVMGALGMARKLSSAGGGMRQGVVNPQASPSPWAVTTEREIAEGLQAQGIKGSAQAQRLQVNDRYNQLGKQIQDTLAKSKKQVRTSIVVKRLDDALNDSLGFVEGDATYETARRRLTEKLLTSANKGKTGLTLKPSSLYDFKKYLNKQLSGAFTKLEKGSPLTPAEEVGMTFWKTIDEVLGVVVPEVKSLTQAQSLLHKASPGLAKSANKAYGIPLPTMRVPFPNRLAQAASDYTGRALQGAGAYTQNIPVNQLTQAAVLGQQALPGEQQAPSLETFAPSIPTNEAEPANQLTPELMAQMRLVMTDAEFSKLEKFYELTTGRKDDAASRKRVRLLNQASPVVLRLTQEALTGSTGFWGAVKAQAGKIPGIDGGNPEKLNRTTRGLAKLIAGAFAGESGVGTDTDVERWLALMPKPGDTRQERKYALEQLMTSLVSEYTALGQPIPAEISQSIQLLGGN